MTSIIEPNYSNEEEKYQYLGGQLLKKSNEFWDFHGSDFKKQMISSAEFYNSEIYEKYTKMKKQLDIDEKYVMDQVEKMAKTPEERLQTPVEQTGNGRKNKNTRVRSRGRKRGRKRGRGRGRGRGSYNTAKRK
jgi:hypothetical protein